MGLDEVFQLVQVIAVVSGVVISILSFNHARVAEAKTKKIEALAPFYQLRQERYVEVSQLAAILTDQDYYSTEEIKEATKRFRALYIAELSMVESGNVEKSMMKLAVSAMPELLTLNEAQSAAYKLSHSLRESFANEL